MPDPVPTALEHADKVMIRSEEELQVNRRRRPRERVRIVKRVVAEQRTVTIEVRREELVVEREPIDSGAGDLAAPVGDPDFAPIEIVLHEEEVVLEKRIVPRERVRVTRELVTEEHAVVEELRREEIELERERL